MRRTIRLRESELRRMISESVKRVLREQEEYDWEEFEQDPEVIKDYDNDASWSNKEAADFHDKVLSKPSDMPIDDDEIEYFSKLLGRDYKGPDFPNGYKNQLNFGDKTELDSIYGDTVDHLNDDDWDRTGYSYDKAEQERQSQSGLNERRIRRIVKESISKILREAKDYETKEEQQKRLQKKNKINKFKNYDDSDDEWKDTYTDKEGRRIQSKGHGSKKQWKILKK